MHLIRRVEHKHFPCSHPCDLNPQQSSQLFRLPKLANQSHDIIHPFPHIQLSPQLLPLTHSLLPIQLTITPHLPLQHPLSSILFVIHRACGGHRSRASVIH